MGMFVSGCCRNCLIAKERAVHDHMVRGFDRLALAVLQISDRQDKMCLQRIDNGTLPQTSPKEHCPFGIPFIPDDAGTDISTAAASHSENLRDK